MSELIATPKSMKQVILSGIRSSLIELGSATKVELSIKLGVSFPTISKFLGEMEKEGELFVRGLDDSSGGRRAKRYAYNPEYMLGLAIFFERTETNFSIFNCLGEVKERGTTSSVLTSTDLSLLTNIIKKMIERYPKIKVISIGVPGSVDKGRVFYIPDYEQLKNFDLKGYYENMFSIPVVIENDMNAAVLGFNRNIGTTENQSLIYLYFGQNGPGAGVLINGNIVRGRSFFAGEVSFVPQYDKYNFFQALESRANLADSQAIDSISRLIASFVAIINPNTVIFCHDEVDDKILHKIEEQCTNYVPREHLPLLTESNWKEDYLVGLQSLGLDVMFTNTMR